MGVMPKTILVVPCFNEERRLRLEAWEPLLATGIDVIFVDDGSSDRTAALLNGWRQAHDDHVAVHVLPRNQGKAEAVRQGLLLALERGATIVGYADADLATPAVELVRLARRLESLPDTVQVVMGSRLSRLGARIERKPLRHYAGRVFATLASMYLGLSVYDTQCGAKYFRATPALRRALDRPFLSRWVFDIELLRRLQLSESAVVEEPLQAWTHIPGSKLSLVAYARAAVDTFRLLLRK